MKEQFYDLLASVLSVTEFELLKKWLDSTDFFVAPASTKFHDNDVGGLLKHSLAVYKRFKELDDRFSLVLTDREIVICGLLHDVCKANVYKKEVRNKKIDGTWREVPEWVFKDDFPLGHGEKSVILLQRCILLDDLETFAIRWHMGPFTDGFESWGVNKSFNDAVEKYPAVAALFSADYEASHFA